jgi:hypothetical protein
MVRIVKMKPFCRGRINPCDLSKELKMYPLNMLTAVVLG